MFNSMLNYMFGLINALRSVLGITYSQDNEDRVLSKLLKKKKKGFYVDVGAHHPVRFSNTYLFYKKGWRGINIDATPGSMKLFNKIRPGDINVECPVSDSHKKINYYIFDEPALNSFSSRLSKERVAQTKYKIKKIIKLKPKKLSEILDEKLPPKTKIDFMSIDVEGFEYNVLVSNNWKKYKPEYLLVEILQTSPGLGRNRNVSLFLKHRGYHVITRTGRTVIFKRKNDN